MALLESKSFWYFCATVSGLCAVIAVLQPQPLYFWAGWNATTMFVELVLASSAPRP